MPKIVPPAPIGSPIDSPEFAQFFELVKNYINAPPFFSRNTDPTFVDIPNGTYSMWLNTTTNTLKLWSNVSGGMRSVTLT